MRAAGPAVQAQRYAEISAADGKTVPEDEAPGLAAQVAEVSELLKGTWISLRIDIDAETRHVVTQVVNRDSGEVIRQIPSEEFLRVSRAMNKLQGLLVSQVA